MQNALSDSLSWQGRPAECEHRAGPKERCATLADGLAKRLFSRTIDALISDGTPRERLVETERCLKKLEAHSQEVPAELLNELRGVVDDFARTVADRSPTSSSYLSERALTDKLFSLYIAISDGGVIF